MVHINMYLGSAFFLFLIIILLHQQVIVVGSIVEDVDRIFIIKGRPVHSGTPDRLNV